jgi:ATPase subunit of ABC transporter with duplicated ATPase domains
MIKKITLSLIGVSMAVAGSACTTYVSGPTYYNDCYYDYYGNYVCDTYYYNGDGTTDTSRDVITNIAQAEQQKLEAQAKHYADKFSLSVDQGMKIAKTIADFNAVQNRSDADVADFAQRLYGVNPTDIVAAVGKAQAGDNTQLNGLVAEAAKNFNTTADNMKNIVKTLHGKMLEQQGIRF